MEAHTTITLRKELLGALHDFCRDSGLCQSKIHDLTVKLVPLLAHYTEEGAHLRPCVYLVSDWTRFISENALQQHLILGQAEPSAEGIEYAIKKAAPLATDGWSILISIDEQQVVFGVVAEGIDPRAISIRSEISKARPDSVRCVRFRQVSEGAVNLLSAHGCSITVHFSSIEVGTPSRPEEHLSKLTDAIVRDIPEDVLWRESLRSYIFRLVAESVDECHGTIIAVASSSKIPDSVRGSGIVLETPISLTSAVAELSLEASDKPIGLSKLIAYASLIKGMVNSDGITLFSPLGEVLGFNFFVTANNAAVVLGGARSRAFSAMKERVGTDFSFVMKRSQDGSIDVAK